MWSTLWPDFCATFQICSFIVQEYFYDDYEKIRLVLGDEKRKSAGGPQFFEAEEPDAQKLFGTDADFPLNVSYRLNTETLTNLEAYKNL